MGLPVPFCCMPRFLLLSLVFVATTALRVRVQHQDDAPQGLFCGKLMGIIHENMTITGTNFSYNNRVTPPFHKPIVVSCPSEAFVWKSSGGGKGILDITADLDDPNDCLAKAGAGDPKSRPSFEFDGKNIVSKNGYGSVKMEPEPSGTCK